MNINTNSFGNYNIYKTHNARPNKGVAKAEFKMMSEQITSEEKDFFVKMYPENKQEIVDHHFYAKNGIMSGVSVGSLFDRRG